MKNDLKQLIPILPLVLSLVWMIATAKADQTFWPYLQASLSDKPWVFNCPTHQGSPEQQEIVCKAWAISGHDKDFILLLKSENGLLDPHRKHNQPYYRNGKAYNDWGLCGISDYYHSKITNDQRFFNADWQIEQCYKLYKGGTKFWGFDRRHRVAKYFKFYP